MFITRTRWRGWRTGAALALLHLAALLDAAVYLLSLSLLSSDFRATLLFSEWLSRFEP